MCLSDAVELKIEAERKAGAMLAGMEKAKGKRTDLVASCGQVSGTPTLSDLGITKSQSHRWQH